jgi:hypothetical protein
MTAELPIKYLVVCTGYTERLLEDEFDEKLFDFSEKYNVTPFFIIGPEYFDTPNAEDVQIATSIITRLNNEWRSFVVFKVDSLATATKTSLNIKSLDYCSMYDIKDIKFLKNECGDIDIMYVKYDSESG